jgi:hypothetical protein
METGSPSLATTTTTRSGHKLVSRVMRMPQPLGHTYEQTLLLLQKVNDIKIHGKVVMNGGGVKF